MKRFLICVAILAIGMVGFVALLASASGPEFESQVTPSPTLFPTPVLVPPAAILFQVEKWGNIDVSSISTPTLLLTPTVLPPQAYLPLVQRNYVYVSPTPTPLPSPTPTPTPTPIPPHPGRGTAGSASCEILASIEAKWFYDWGPHPRADCEGIEPVAVIWGRDNLGAVIGEGVTIVAGYNEPDHWDQANVTPTLAAIDWITMEILYSPQYQLVSPAVVNEPWGEGLSWLIEWYQDVNDLVGRPPTMIAIAVHFYPVGYGDAAIADAIEFLSQAVALADQWGVDLWITEFAQLPCMPGGTAEAIRFMKEVIDWMATQPTIKRFSWFHTALPYLDPIWDWGPCDPSLADYLTGELRPLGEEYRLH